jgi:hypothetical protein
VNWLVVSCELQTSGRIVDRWFIFNCKKHQFYLYLKSDTLPQVDSFVRVFDMSEVLRAPALASISARRSMGGAVRLKRSTSVSTSNSLSDCDESLEIDSDNEDTTSKSRSQSKRRKSTLVWESSPKRPSKRTSSHISIAFTVSSAEGSDNITVDAQVPDQKDHANLSVRSSTSSKGSRSSSSGGNMEGSRESAGSASDEKLQTAQKPWSLEDFTLGKALGKVNTLAVKQYLKKTNLRLPLSPSVSMPTPG